MASPRHTEPDSRTAEQAIMSALGVAAALLVGAYFALHDAFKSWLADVIPGFPRGCSANGWEALPGLLLILGATGVVGWAWRHPTDRRWLGYVVKSALVLLSVVSVLGTLAWLVATGGMFCTVD